MTRAPRSASRSVQNGPARTRVRSMTIVPDSGPATVICVGVPSLIGSYRNRLLEASPLASTRRVGSAKKRQSTRPEGCKMSREFADVPAMLKALTPSYPVFCLRPHVIEAAARQFLELFPGRVLYAVKCNPHPLVLR